VIQKEAVPNRGGLDPRDRQAPRSRQPFARIEKRDLFRGTWKVRPPTSRTLLGSTRTVTAAGLGA
jgi:hypothetical protein